MQIIFLKDVGGVGRKDEVKEISDGYALNFLIPKGLAMQATPEKIATLKKRVLESNQEQGEMEAQTISLLKKLNGTRFEISARANDQGHLFKGISKINVAEAISKQNGVLDPALMEEMPPIKQTGEYTVRLRGAGREATLTFVVNAE